MHCKIAQRKACSVDRSRWSFIVINNFRASSINYLAISALRLLASQWAMYLYVYLPAPAAICPFTHLRVRSLSAPRTVLLCAVFHRELSHHKPQVCGYGYLCTQINTQTPHSTAPNLLKWTMLQRCVEILFPNGFSNSILEEMGFIHRFVCRHICNQSQQNETIFNNWYICFLAFTHDCCGCVCTGLYKCTVKCHNKHFVCTFDCWTNI